MKRFVSALLIAMFMSVSYGETYNVNYEKIGGDVDWLIFENHTSDDLIIRYAFNTTCDVCTVKHDKKVKIRIGIDGGRHAKISIPVTFEVKTLSNEIKNVSWVMNGKHNDINIILEDDKGWNF